MNKAIQEYAEAYAVYWALGEPEEGKERQRFLEAQSALEAPAAPVRTALPRYQEWMHLREHGVWTAGVPEWARDHLGRMNDFAAARAVIEELSGAALAAAPQAPAVLAREPLTQEHIQDLIGFGDPTEQECYLVRLGWDAAKAAPAAPAVDAREDVARAIWNVMREYEDRCDMDLEDMGEHCHAWALADAAIGAQAKGET